MTDPLTQALQHFRGGDLGRAKGILTQFLAGQPRHFDALHLLGVVSAIEGAQDEAESLYKKALRIDGNHAELRVNLALTLAATGKFDEALINIERALSLDGSNAGAHFTRGNILRDLKRREEALASFERALALDPGKGGAWTSRGVVLGELKLYPEALASYDRALVINPGASETWMNRGIALSRLKRYEEALASHDKALGLNPGLAEAWSNRGNVLGELKRHGDALASFDRSLRINPGSPEVWSNRGNILGELARYDEALASFDEALRIDPSHAEAWYNRGIALSELKSHDEALASYERALGIETDIPYCLGNWLHAKQALCDWNGLEDACGRVLAEIDKGFPAAPPFVSLAMPITARQQKRCAEIYVGDNYAHMSPDTPAFAGRTNGQKIRIGYFSSDFKAHAVSYLTVGLFEAHDRNRFEIHGFGLDRGTNDETRNRVVTAFDRFTDLSALDSPQAAAAVRELGIEIAVDLNGHTSGCRTELFCARIAPVQVNYIGHPGTMGADFVDYIIGDRIVVPEESRDDYSEKIVYLPHTFQVNDSRRPIAAPVSRKEYGLKDGDFVFCCFCNSHKLTPGYFAACLRLLRRVDDSVLWLIARSDSQAARLKDLANEAGVSRERVVFAGQVAYAAHLARYRAADLVLDTSPFSGGATTSDALWAGAPVITILGNTFAGRMSASLLHAIGLPELIAGSLDEYEAMAFELATNPPRLAAVRGKLARNRSTHPLFDTVLFTRHIEAAYSKMWERYLAGLPPDHLQVEA